MGFGGTDQELAKKYNIFSSIFPRYRVIDLFGCGYAAPGLPWLQPPLLGPVPHRRRLGVSGAKCDLDARRPWETAQYHELGKSSAVVDDLILARFVAPQPLTVQPVS